MSDYNNRDPYNPTPMGPAGGAYDQYGNSRFEPVESTGRGPYILLAILVAIGVIGGLLYFNHKPMNEQQAQAPITHTTTTPTTPAPPLSGAPASPANPGGTTTPGAGGAAAPTTAPTGGTH
jgi:hypothetical protein